MLTLNNQPYQSWKGKNIHKGGETTISSVPSLTRYEPPPPGLVPVPAQGRGPNFRRANPMKHYRYQLNHTSYIKRSSSHIDGNYMNKPGSTFNLGFNATGQNKCCASDLSGSEKHVTQTYIKKFPQLTKENTKGKKIQNNGDISMGQIYFGNNTDHHATIQTGIWETKCIACNPENNVLKPARTLLSKAYYTDSRAYLRSRNQTYDQNLAGSKLRKPNGQSADEQYYYDNTKKLKYPRGTNSTSASSFASLNCPDKCQEPVQGGTVIVTYKPSNRQFGQEGAVSSSTRLEKLKLDTVNKNAKSFKPAWGSEGANAAKYNGSYTAPYFLKSKNNNVCNQSMFNKNIYHVNGNKTVCFHTNTGDRQLQSKTTTMVYTRPNKVAWGK